MIKIGIFGFGCVGQGFYQALGENSLPVEIKRIVVRNGAKTRPVDPGLLSLDPSAILNDPEIDVVVELIDDADEAFNIVSTAIRSGKSVITANKKMVSGHLPTLHALAEAHGVKLYYEGAVCGAIPVLQNLDRYFATETIQQVHGIVNGSTNYILSKVLDEDISYEEALQQAQENGFAESDPSLDVDGHDPSFKLRILIWHAFQQNFPAEKIFRRGIRQIQKQDVRYARENGWKIKLIARATRYETGIRAMVAPEFVAPNDPLYHVNNEYNSIELKGNLSGMQRLTGKGAGSLPTGLAVLSDLNACVQGISQRTFDAAGYQPNDNTLHRVYAGFKHHDDVPAGLFQDIDEHYAGQGNHGYIVGAVRYSDLQTLENNEDVSLILLPGHLRVQERLAAVR